MAHTNVHMLMGNLTTGESTPTFYIDRVNGRVGVGTDATQHTDGTTYAFDVSGSLYATELHGDGSNLTGLTDSKWVESITNPDDIYYTTGNVGIGGDAGTVPLKVYGNVESTGDFVGGILGSDRTIRRTSHSNGYLVGSHNLFNGGNSTKTNPIYTIGSGYMPSDDSLGNMYGIGYSHGNFTGILSGGWGMYVAADGDARIGLNGSSGHIKCTGYVDAGNYVTTKNHINAGTYINAGTEVYCQNWIRTRGNSGHYWESSSNGHGWHIYPRDRSDMYFRTGSGNGGIAGTVGDSTPRGYIHWTTGNEIGFLNASRHWSLRMDNYNHCYVSGHIRVHGYANYYLSARYYNYKGNNGWDTRTRSISVYSDYQVRCEEVQVTSDSRIKKDIRDIDDSSALDILRKLQPKTYGYVDIAEKGINSVYGFIAQEVKEVIPNAVDVSEGDVPNVYKWATIDIETNAITLENFDTSNLCQTNSIVYIDHEEQKKTLKIKSVLNSTQLEIEENLEEIVNNFLNISEDDKKADYEFNNKLFIWGQKVDDFHHLQKSAIYTIATAALQEVDRQLQAEKTKVATLETQLASVLARLDALENA